MRVVYGLEGSCGFLSAASPRAPARLAVCSLCGRPEPGRALEDRRDRAFAGPDRPLVWIDDDHDAACHAWATARPGPTLLVSTDPEVGLTRAHAARARAWTEALQGTRAQNSCWLDYPVDQGDRRQLGRFWFCGSASRPKRSNRTRRCALTASTERWISSAIVLVGGGGGVGRVLERAAERDQHLALALAERDVHVELDRGGRCRPRRRRASGTSPASRRTRSGRRPQPAAAAEALAVDVGAVAREPVVDDDPLAADRFHLRVHPRDLRVPASAMSRSGSGRR